MQYCKRNRPKEKGDTVKSFDNWNDECLGFSRDDTVEEIEEARLQSLIEFRREFNR